ncbi:hypothetical protein LTR09_000302 [Extremus antarcticus]|uniref:Uncharacterized protein n=1 Tax=Extremus antarcticus TaxID=702011 RepID=A0AAJ0LX74_9PEZI|nr:hypothetical protein LTR09_000302 [Extremus antarcticus]
MILNQIAWVDCIAFLVFLAPQLLIQVGFLETARCGIKALPFLLIQMPYQFLRERYFTPYSKKPPFVRTASPFQDIVIRCVRYAFASIPATIGKVFFSKPVALPFAKFRMLRHGYLRSPIYWREVHRGDLNGLYIIADETRRPDIVVYYCHGGGFSMGSAFFYLEFLLAWVHLLKTEGGYENPALFALDYTLVPEATYPTQLQQTLTGYKYVLSLVDSASSVVVSGDSAGATLMLSLLLCLSDYTPLRNRMPGLAVIISPWAAIISPKNKNTASDYLNAESLHLYGSQYVGTKASADDALVSPGRCKDLSWWRRASPTAGWFFVYGAEEVFAPETRDLIDLLRKAGAGGDTKGGKDAGVGGVEVHEEPNWVHAWPVVKLFLCNGSEERMSGLRSIVRVTRERVRV